MFFKITPSAQLTLGAVLTTAVAILAPAAAAEYRTRVIACGLVRPTGIVAGVPGTLYVTQLPTPGVAGPDGGLNKVSEVRVAGGRTTTLTLGEPEPTNLAVSQSGELYWTCKSAGVILQRTPNGMVSLFLGGLQEPNGIAVDQAGFVYFTRLPTPGVNGPAGGFNTVNVTDGQDVEVLTLGEPEPTDIAVARDGAAYWTCKSAGVIRMQTPAGVVSLVREGLNAPTGIALDEARGSLYFTEVPTPGIPGSQGGANRVAGIELASGSLEIVDEGDPEPTDITVAKNGRVYWTCTSAGVIVEARRMK